jgi:hypothetical protein
MTTSTGEIFDASDDVHVNVSASATSTVSLLSNRPLMASEDEVLLL